MNGTVCEIEKTLQISLKKLWIVWKEGMVKEKVKKRKNLRCDLW